MGSVSAVVIAIVALIHSRYRHSNDPVVNNGTNRLAGQPWLTSRVERLERLQEIANIPIVFYGMAIDQYGNPIESVHVEAIVSQIGGELHSHHRVTNALSTDIAGDFAVSGILGESLELKLDKPGYELSADSIESFGYGPAVGAHHEPHRTTPVVYRFWKRGKFATLKSSRFEQKISADGTPIAFNTMTGQPIIGMTNPSNPTLRIWRDPLRFDYQKSMPEEWRYEFIWPGGNVQPTQDTFCYRAPDKDYSDKIEQTFRKGTSGYRLREKQSFYFINGLHQFGTGVLEIWADRNGDEAEVMLSMSWNPDGTQNLEPEPMDEKLKRDIATRVGH